MSLTRLLITSVAIENRPVLDVAAQYGVSESWLFELLARYKAEGEAAFEPRSRRPQSSPTAIPTGVVDLIIELREKLTATGLDAGPDTIGWHLAHHHDVTVSWATISRYLTKHALVTPEPKKKPKSSYIRFQAAMPNQTWQSDFTHYRLTRPAGPPGADIVCAPAAMIDIASGEFFAMAHRLYPAAKRVLIVPRGGPAAPSLRVPAGLLQDQSVAQPVLRAMTLGLGTAAREQGRGVSSGCQ
jgi:transposase InsO family protein